MHKLISSFEVKPLEGQTEAVNLVAALPVNMHRVTRLLLEKLHLVPLVLIHKVW